MRLWSVVGGSAAVGAAAVLLIGLAAMASGRRPVRPWLVTLFTINAGCGGVSRRALRGAAPVDVLLLVLAAVTYAGFWPGPGGHHRVWMILAVGQPLLGVPLLLGTRLWGRSGLMGGGLVLSVLMLVDGVRAVAGWLGVGCFLLLLVGDMGTTGRASRVRATLLAVGYGGLVAWLGLAAVLLLT